MDTTVRTPADDARLRERVSRVLHYGFWISAGLMVLGIVIALIKQEPLPETLGSPNELVRALFDGKPGGIIGLGILAMILSPFASTVVIALEFFRMGDRRYGRIALLVLAILCVAIVVSLVF